MWLPEFRVWQGVLQGETAREAIFQDTASLGHPPAPRPPPSHLTPCMLHPRIPLAIFMAPGKPREVVGALHRQTHSMCVCRAVVLRYDSQHRACSH